MPQRPPRPSYTADELAALADTSLSHRAVAARLGRSEKSVARRRERAVIHVGRTWETGFCQRQHELTQDNIYVRPNGGRECRQCKESHQGPRSSRRARKRCGRGHERTEENTKHVHYANGMRRICLDCRRDDRDARFVRLAAKYPPVVDLPGELWKPVVGAEKRYSVSNMGRVRGEHGIWAGERKERYQTFSRLLSTRLRKDGRVGITLLFDGIAKTRNVMVHRLVLEAFVGSCPEGMQCCHWDDVPTNNRLSNLRWDTPAENEKDKARNAARRLPIDELRAILAEREALLEAA